MSNHDDMTTVSTTPNPKQEASTMQTNTSTNGAKPAAADAEGRKKPAKAKKPANIAKPRPARVGHPMTVPLDKLAADPANVRPDAGDVAELAASIAAHGVIQPLCVRPEAKRAADGTEKPTGRYLVVAGGRRLRALMRLAGTRRLPKDAGVPCVVRQAGERDAAEVSLAENVERVPMNAADEHAAFAKLADGGMSGADIARRFGLTKRRVEQRLALGRIAPDLLAELRKGDMTAGVAQALTLTTSHDRQRDVWRQVRGGWGGEQHARRLLTEQSMGTDHPLMRLVGRAAYERAGGAVRVDLFGREEDGEGFAEDAALVRRLAAEKLDREAERARADGWAFAAHELQGDANALRLPPRAADPPRGDEGRAGAPGGDWERTDGDGGRGVGRGHARGPCRGRAVGPAGGRA